MEQLKGLWRDTKNLWLGFVVMIVVLSILISWYYLALIPVLPVPFVYFAYGRYDENGNEKGDLE